MPILAVVANKGHKYEYEEVSYEEGESFAHEIGAIFQESSKLSNFGINNLFKNIGKSYLIPGLDYKKKLDVEKEEYLKKKKEYEEIRKKYKKDRKCIIF